MSNMTESFFDRVVVPVANRADATATTAALMPYLEDADCTVIAVHVIEKAGGALDKASVEQRERRATGIFGIVIEQLGTAAAHLETELRYGTDVAASVVETAQESDAGAIVFTPRGGSRWQKLVTGDVTHKLVGNSDIPIVVLPDREATEA